MNLLLHLQDNKEIGKPHVQIQ